MKSAEFRPPDSPGFELGAGRAVGEVLESRSSHLEVSEACCPCMGFAKPSWRHEGSSWW